ncbi:MULTISPECIES: 3-isopropylmalate dehydratase large subunit [Psychrilyobacter]|uniref:Homoaconitate hydratase family protein n=1 Tax=Psychrilyobacter piezotolerans TaxID=2293438 RepID=A0ABX9KJY7_9FUSO|nr:MULTISPECIES: aconitase/3-isopropylmalate dehydratase large subunit family protein [Psychrilyobacter]MCS5420512.1 aconitase/3-isopropylmalate dehydratase large subunit family protein [Psychrilyobacter sp. S5]NDI76896.1 homoaconitate hydratase family protein [Psychrilyobacter piezotolerans]RDE65174.1 homoaconitate hydratase family protein [Psychrilyobacter sp. S5]REI42744.1 homoaconitate hydratase family protein [Psychrilyobacter piezotolerans]
MTIVEKILADRSNKDQVKPGDNIWVDVDILMTHDVCGPGTMGIFKGNFGEDARVWDKGKIVLIPDHYIFTKDKYAMRNIDYVTKFAKEQEIVHFYEPFTDDYKGVCHVALAEEGHNKPGDVLFGTDSHTCTSGAFGQFASGIGNTDAGFIMGTGKLWVRVPESIKFQFEGEFPSYIMGKDVVLQTIKDIGFDGGTYRCMEYGGDAVSGLNMEERMTICNMAIEAGGKCGIIAADEITKKYLEERGVTDYQIHNSDKDAVYHSVHTYDAGKIIPVVAKPYSPGNVEPAENLSHIEVTRSYIGSCTGGKTTDFVAAAKILKGEKVKIETFIVPATRNVERNFEKIRIGGETLKEIFENAGCKIGPPSCAACLGGPEDTFGRTHADEVVISTTNRNFHGRMGSMDSKVYLASPYTAAASALTGKITDPRKYIKKIEVEIDG